MVDLINVYEHVYVRHRMQHSILSHATLISESSISARTSGQSVRGRPRVLFVVGSCIFEVSYDFLAEVLCMLTRDEIQANFQRESLRNSIRNSRRVLSVTQSQYSTPVQLSNIRKSGLLGVEVSGASISDETEERRDKIRKFIWNVLFVCIRGDRNRHLVKLPLINWTHGSCSKKTKKKNITEFMSWLSADSP